jgi:hypothetical protein
LNGSVADQVISPQASWISAQKKNRPISLKRL